MAWEPSAVEASLIATAITLLGILITTQAKVSEFRQQWINALRDDVAALITHSLILHAANAEDDTDESYLQIHQTTARITLRLNPQEDATKEILAAMNEVREANHRATDFAEMNQCINELTVAVQKVLKKEWKRVKYGEPLYRVVFLLAITGALLSLCMYLHQKFGWSIHLVSALRPPSESLSLFLCCISSQRHKLLAPVKPGNCLLNTRR